MTNEQHQVKEMMSLMRQETPEKPVIPSLEVRKLRAKLILEEALETIAAMNLLPYVRRNHYEDDMIEDDSIGFWEDPKRSPNLVKIADGCEDLKVVTEGTLVACGLVAPVEANEACFGLPGFDPLFNEVMRSNMSKLWTPNELELKEIDQTKYKITKVKNFEGHYEDDNDTAVYIVLDQDGKFIKPPSYSPANLTSIIEEMQK